MIPLLFLMHHYTLRQKIRQITNYMKRKHLSRAVQVRVRKYLEYYLEGDRTYRVEEQEVLKMLSIPLQNEVLVELNVKALHDCKVFTHSFTQKFLASLAKDLKEITLSPEEIIFRVTRFFYLCVMLTYHCLLRKKMRTTIRLILYRRAKSIYFTKNVIKC